MDKKDNNKDVEQNISQNGLSDVVYTAILMKKLTNLQGMVRDLYMLTMQRKKGIKAVMMETGNDYIDEIGRFITDCTK